MRKLFFSQNRFLKKFFLSLLIIFLIFVVFFAIDIFRVELQRKNLPQDFKVIHQYNHRFDAHEDAILGPPETSTSQEIKILNKLYTFFKEENFFEQNWSLELPKKTMGSWNSLTVISHGKTITLVANTVSGKSEKIIKTVESILAQYPISRISFSYD